jgi:RNase P subunit RPR2
MDNIEWTCNKCQKPLKLKNTVFEYMGRSFSHEVLVCLVCGKVYIPQALAEGRMAEVESALEDK